MLRFSPIQTSRWQISSPTKLPFAQLWQRQILSKKSTSIICWWWCNYFWFLCNCRKICLPISYKIQVSCPPKWISSCQGVFRGPTIRQHGNRADRIGLIKISSSCADNSTKTCQWSTIATPVLKTYSEGPSTWSNRKASKLRLPLLTETKSILSSPMFWSFFRVFSSALAHGRYCCELKNNRYGWTFTKILAQTLKRPAEILSTWYMRYRDKNRVLTWSKRGEGMVKKKWNRTRK